MEIARLLGMCQTKLTRVVDGKQLPVYYKSPQHCQSGCGSVILCSLEKYKTGYITKVVEYTTLKKISLEEQENEQKEITRRIYIEISEIREHTTMSEQEDDGGWGNDEDWSDCSEKNEERKRIEEIMKKMTTTSK